MATEREDDGFSPNYPKELPISAHREEIVDALRRSQVVIVCGDTGSGKTTQTMTTWSSDSARTDAA